MASGKDILKASDDPLGAIQLSAVQDQKELLGKFTSNIAVAQSRLEQANSVIEEITNVVTRMSELTTLAGNGAYDGYSRAAIAQEMEQLVDVLLSQANTKAKVCFLGLMQMLKPFPAMITVISPIMEIAVFSLFKFQRI